jgi:hypothetical protein
MTNLAFSDKALQAEAGPANSEMKKEKELFEGLLAHRKTVEEILRSRISRLPILKLETTGNALRDAEKARYLLQELPREDVLEDWRKELEQALRPTHDEEIIKLLLSMMLSGFPKQAGSNSEGYFRALGLAYGDKNMALDLIAYTIRCILRSRVFPPSISEFVTEYEAVRNSTECVAERVRKAIKIQNQATEAIRAACSKKEQPEANFTGKEAFSPGFSSHCKMKGD